MTTIFLDIDGVLATNKQYMMNSDKFAKNNEWAKRINVYYPFDKGCCDVLNGILAMYECEIVISSDWRLHYTLDELDEIFRRNGLIASPIDATEDFLNFDMRVVARAREIEWYLLSHGMIDNRSNATADWIVIDDLNVAKYFPVQLKDRCFQTDDFSGLKKTGVKEKIIKKLNDYERIQEAKGKL